jgi:hypothetical protein
MEKKPMKKSIYLIPLAVIMGLFSAPSFADGWRHHHGHHGWGHHHGHHRYHPAPEVHYFYPQPQVNYYVPAPPPPPVAYYPAPPVYHSYDRRNPTGLAGGVIGSVFGYELGRGDPIATGLGAAAGSFLGNGMYGGY